MTEPFGRHRLGSSDTRLSFGESTLHLRSENQEIWWAVLRGPESEISWTRWVSGINDCTVEVVPCLPDLPVVVEPEVPFALAPKSRARVFVGIRPWIRIRLADRPQTTIMEFPFKVLSQTWWGDPTGGEPAYGHVTRARRELNGDLGESFSIHCPMSLANESAETLPVEKVAVRVPQLSVYDANGVFWTNEIKVHFTADVDGSRLEFLDGPPPEGGSARLVVSPRTPPPRMWKVLTFGRRRQTGGWGI